MKLFRLFGRAAKLWYMRDADQHSAALAYFTPFALTPLIIFSITIVGFIVGTDRIVAMLLSWGNAIDPGVTDLLYSSVVNFELIERHYVLPVVGIIFLSLMIVVALNSFGAALHHIWDVERGGWANFGRRLLRIIGVILLAQLYLVFVILFQETLSYVSWFNATLWFAVLKFISLFFINVLMLTLVYDLLALEAPSFFGRLAGATVACLLLMFGREIVAFHFATAPVQSLFGAAGLLITLLVWVYVASGVLLYGAAFARAYDESETGIIPTS